MKILVRAWVTLFIFAAVKPPVIGAPLLLGPFQPSPALTRGIVESRVLVK